MDEPEWGCLMLDPRMPLYYPVNAGVPQEFCVSADADGHDKAMTTKQPSR